MSVWMERQAAVSVGLVYVQEQEMHNQNIQTNQSCTSHWKERDGWWETESSSSSLQKASLKQQQKKEWCHRKHMATLHQDTT